MFAVVVNIPNKTVAIHDVSCLSMQDFMNKRNIPFEQKYNDKYSIWEGDECSTEFAITNLDSYPLSKEEAKQVFNILCKQLFSS